MNIYCLAINRQLSSLREILWNAPRDVIPYKHTNGIAHLRLNYYNLTTGICIVQILRLPIPPRKIPILIPTAVGRRGNAGSIATISRGFRGNIYIILSETAISKNNSRTATLNTLAININAYNRRKRIRTNPTTISVISPFLYLVGLNIKGLAFTLKPLSAVIIIESSEERKLNIAVLRLSGDCSCLFWTVARSQRKAKDNRNNTTNKSLHNLMLLWIIFHIIFDTFTIKPRRTFETNISIITTAPMLLSSIRIDGRI